MGERGGRGSCPGGALVKMLVLILLLFFAVTDINIQLREVNKQWMGDVCLFRGVELFACVCLYVCMCSVFVGVCLVVGIFVTILEHVCGFLICMRIFVHECVRVQMRRCAYPAPYVCL